MLSRVISMFATRADLSVDELSDAVLLSDAISASGTEGFADGTARIAIREEDGSFEVRVGPLATGGGQRLIDGLRIPELDASLEGLADEIRVDARRRRRSARDPHQPRSARADRRPKARRRSPVASRSLPSARRRMRETCICE